MIGSKHVALVLLLSLSCGPCIYGLRILGVFPLPSRSHYILGSAMMKGLAERGHDVTIITPLLEKNPPPNYHEIFLTGFTEKFQEMVEGMNMYDQESMNTIFTVFLMFPMMAQWSDDVLAHENVQKLIHSNEKFDVVIIEQFVNDAHKALASHFKAPFIMFSTMGTNFWIDALVGNPSAPSYIPNLFLDYSSNMTFLQRAYNTFYTFLNKFLHHVYLYPKHNRAIKKYFPNGPELEGVLYNASLVLLNAHPSTNQPTPYVPNMIDIGGFHVNPSKELPQDLQEFLDNATEGVIYFSMGSNLKSAEFPVEKREAFLKTFSKLKLKVLWKWEDDVLPGQPSNVKLGKWLPQQEILAHPNVKLFITHGGLLSTTETVYHGVPILAIPIFGDQKINAYSAQKNGIGLMLPYRDITEESLTEKLNELLSNPRYAENAKERSAIFHDRLVGPMDTAAYWVEYVARHKGASHLRVAALDLPWYKYYLLDVISFGLLLVVLFLSVFIFVVKKALRRVSKSKRKTE